MVRVKRGTTANKTRRNVLAKVKGYRHGRKSKERMAYDAIAHAGAYAFAHRRDKKNDFRRLWNVRLNAALREQGTTYSKFIGALKKAGIELDRKVMSELAQNHASVFKAIVGAAIK
jgi:large subunit ribosomal protein L20